jgi:hypothetical protein
MKRHLVAISALALIHCQNPTQETDSDNISQESKTVGCDGSDRSDYMEEIDHYLRDKPTDKWTKADCKLLAPVWTGDDDKGQLFTPLWRGTAAGIEDWVPPPPNGNCTGLKGTVRIDWDKSKNTVSYSIKFTGLPVSPTITRTDGGDPEIRDPNAPGHYVGPPAANYWYNAFHRSPKDFPARAADGTAYRLWTIFTTYGTSSTPFYYSGSDLKLRGSAYDFPAGPPPGTFPVAFPTVSIVSTQLFYPNSKGFASRQYTVDYDKVTGEGRFWAHAPVGFVPHNLCRAIPTQPTLGQLRPYVTPFRPKSEGLPWNYMLRQGLLFDLTIEEGRPDVPKGQDDNNLDYVYSGLAFLNNNASLPGGVPWGQHFSLPNVIQNVQPMTESVPKCGGFVSHPHVTAPLYCQGER